MESFILNRAMQVSQNSMGLYREDIELNFSILIVSVLTVDSILGSFERLACCLDISMLLESPRRLVLLPYVRPYLLFTGIPTLVRPKRSILSYGPGNPKYI